MKLAALVAILLVLAATGMGQSKLNSKVGMVEPGGEKGPCFSIRNAHLKVGQRVLIVKPEGRQSVINATVTEKLAEPCKADGEHDKASFYSLKVKTDDTFVAIGVVNIPRIGVIKGVASADLNGDGRKEYFRSCTSGEGAHLTIWTGKPLTGKRVWHGYYYAGYDTKSNCRKKDYQ